MSSLDLGTAPEPLVLAPPAPVTLVTPDQAAHAVAVPAPKQTELQHRAAGFADELAALDHRSPQFTEKINSITTMGDKDMRVAAGAASRMLDRPAATLGKKGGDAQTRVAGTLADLRVTITELDPQRADLTGVKKALRWLPGGDKVDRYFARYQSAQNHLDAIIRSLASGQDELRKDNAAIETEKANLWASMNRLSEYKELAGALDEALLAKIAALESSGRAEDATALTSDALFAIRQRRQDIMTQMAISAQGYLALDLIRKNNIELIKGVDRSQTTTVAMLRIAVIVAQALTRQKLVLDQINALNTVTSNLIEATSQQLRTQGAAINEQAVAATIDLSKLQTAFDNVFATMDAVDSFRAQAVQSMEQTVQALEGQVQRAQPYLERARQREGGGV